MDGWTKFKTDISKVWGEMQATWFWLSFPVTAYIIYLYFNSTARDWGKFWLWLYYPELWFK